MDGAPFPARQSVEGLARLESSRAREKNGAGFSLMQRVGRRPPDARAVVLVWFLR
jgi:hypothetical protein